MRFLHNVDQKLLRCLDSGMVKLKYVVDQTQVRSQPAQICSTYLFYSVLSCLDKSQTILLVKKRVLPIEIIDIMSIISMVLPLNIIYLCSKAVLCVILCICACMFVELKQLCLKPFGQP